MIGRPRSLNTGTWRARLGTLLLTRSMSAPIWTHVAEHARGLPQPSHHCPPVTLINVDQHRKQPIPTRILLTVARACAWRSPDARHPRTRCLAPCDLPRITAHSVLTPLAHRTKSPALLVTAQGPTPNGRPRPRRMRRSMAARSPLARGSHGGTFSRPRSASRATAALVDGNSIPRRRADDRRPPRHHHAVRPHARRGLRPAPQPARACDLSCSLIDMDEQWGWVKKKGPRVTAEDPPGVGEAWTWVGLDRGSRARDHLPRGAPRSGVRQRLHGGPSLPPGRDAEAHDERRPRALLDGHR